MASPTQPSNSTPHTSSAPHTSQTGRPSPARRPWAALVVLMLPTLLIALDNTVLSFAIPSISESLRPSGTQLLWIVDAYPIVLAGLLVPMGSLGDRFGRRRLLLIGSSGFAAVSALAAFAPNAELLIASRAALGFFGAMLMPATLSLIRNIFVDPTKRRTAIAVWAGGFSGGAALGPIVGGFLLEHFWWGSVFLLAVPVLIPLLIFGPLLIPESRDPEPGPIDPLSIVLSLGAMVPFIYGIKAMAEGDWGVGAFAPLVVGIAAGVLFVRRQLRRDRPMLDVRLFVNPVFSGSIIANLLSVFSLVGFLFFIAQHLQLVSGRSPMEAGLVLIPGLLITVVAGLAVVRFVRVVRPATVVAAGLLLNAIGYALVLATGNSGSDLGLLTAFAFIGAGVGMAETISNDLILSNVPPTKAGAASAVSETAYELGAALGTAVLGSVLTAVYRANVALPDGLNPSDARAAGETLGGATQVAGGLSEPAASALLESAREAFDSGVVITSLIGVVLMVLSAAVVLRTLRSAVTAK